MPKDLMMIFGIALALFVMQGVGGYFQIQDYKKAIRRMHKLGNVGIGQTKGRLLNGNLVLIACDSEGKITGAEVMEGISFLSHFKAREKFLEHTLKGQSIGFFLDLFSSFDKKKRKKYKGYIQAIEALDLRLNHAELLEDSESEKALTETPVPTP